MRQSIPGYSKHSEVVHELCPVSHGEVGTSWNTSRNAKFDGRQGYRADVELQMTHGERGATG